MTAPTVRSSWLGRTIPATLIAIGAIAVLKAPPPAKEAPSERAAPIVLSQRRFEPNVGQTDPGVRYIVRGAGPQAFVTNDGVVPTIYQEIAGVRKPVGGQFIIDEGGLIGSDLERYERSTAHKHTVRSRGRNSSLCRRRL